MSDPTSRRTALKVGGGGALALLIGGGAGVLDRRDDDTPVADAGPTTSTTTTTTTPPAVVPSIGEVDAGIVALGRRVVAVTGWDDAATLLAEIPDADGDPLAQAAAIVGAEFRSRDTVDVDGWVLARSEARAAAAVALLCADAC